MVASRVESVNSGARRGDSSKRDLAMADTGLRIRLRVNVAEKNEIES
jgi:hypothetical protein